MDVLLEKSIKGLMITEQDVVETLHELCQDVHATCHEECPVFDMNEGIPWNADESNCKCFCDGKAMLKFIRKKLK